MAARSTWRDKAGAGVAYQKAVRDQYLHEAVPKVDLTLKRARIRPITRAFAKQIILKYEWLGTMAGTNLHFGIFFGPYCAGVGCVANNGGGTAGVNKHMEFGIERTELSTLARGACVHWAPPGTNSKLVAQIVRQLPSVSKGKVLIAYGDPDAGEIGTIYQACGWTYIGTTNASKHEVLSPMGRVYNTATVGSWGRKRGISYKKMWAALQKDGWVAQASSPKHKYVAQLDRSDDRLAGVLRRMAKPYPKRAREAE